MNVYLLAIRILLACLLIAMFGFCAVLNLISFWKRNVLDVSFPSGVPFVGGILGAVGLWLLPVPVVSHFAWVAMFLDFGCLPYTAGVSVYLAHDAYIHSQRFLLLQLEGRHDIGTASVVKLYRNGDYILTQTEMPPPMVQLSCIGKWRKEAKMLMFDCAAETICYEPNEAISQFQWLSGSDAGLLDGVLLYTVQ